MTESETAKFKLLVKGVIALSESKVWKDAMLEWDHVETTIAAPDDKERCVCSQPIVEVCHIRNRVTGSELIVGNECVNHFHGNARLIADQAAGLASLLRGQCFRCGGDKPRATGIDFLSGFVCCRCLKYIEWGPHAGKDPSSLRLAPGRKLTVCTTAEYSTCDDCEVGFRKVHGFEKYCFNCYKTHKRQSSSGSNRTYRQCLDCSLMFEVRQGFETRCLPCYRARQLAR